LNKSEPALKRSTPCESLKVKLDYFYATYVLEFSINWGPKQLIFSLSESCKL